MADGTGLADRAKLAKYLFVQGSAKATSEEKGPKGEPITLLDFRDRLLDTFRCQQVDPAEFVVGTEVTPVRPGWPTLPAWRARCCPAWAAR